MFSFEYSIELNPHGRPVITPSEKTDQELDFIEHKFMALELARTIITNTISSDYDDPKKYNSGGIRLYYKKFTGLIEGVKDGILLEAGYDTVAPNMPVTISSWAYNKAIGIPNIEIVDNQATDILCYDHRYTFVEKLQTIATKFRKEMNTGEVPTNYMRQYYDVYSLLGDRRVQEFIGTDKYKQHKEDRFPEEDLKIPINENEAFLLSDKGIRERFQKRYELTKPLYYKGQPPFEEILKRIYQYVNKL